MSDKNMIEIINLSKEFNGHQVLNRLNLTIKKGYTQVVIGRSGGGKSVLLKHIVGLLRADSGQIIVDGQDITMLDEKQLDRLRLKMALLFQGAALFDSLSVGENVGFILREHTDLDELSIRKRVRDSLELVGLKGVEELMPAELSGGMKKEWVLPGRSARGRTLFYTMSRPLALTRLWLMRLTR